MIKRILGKQIIKRLIKTKKSVILYGPRQVGKTTLAKSIIKKIGLKTLFINADDKIYNDVLSSQDLNKIEGLISGYQLIFIDEAQKIENIGINMKLIIDSHPEIRILATGSSSFDLSNKVSEPLTGRVWTYTLFPISCEELINESSEFEYNRDLENHLLYGSYPEIFKYKNLKDKAAYLKQLTNSYLYKDILEYADIKHADKINKLLRLIALQIGNEVSLSELGNSLDISKETVARYLDLLEKSFVIYTLRGFSRNLRKEVTKMNKIYFIDLGVRNSIIENFNSLELRNDSGALWENFLIIERIKKSQYHQNFVSPYFWRLNTGAEMDYIEDGGGKLIAYEFKFGKKHSKSKESWLKNYPGSTFKLINQKNYLEFLK
jgi:predicted AAA+ superfamily ATPase